MLSKRFPQTIVFSVFLVATAAIADEPAANPAVDARAYQTAVDRAVEYLKTKGQAPDGTYSKFAGSGVTSVVTTALLRQGLSPDDPLVARSLKYLEGLVQPDGGIFAPKSDYQNYETSLALMCFAEANKDHRYDKIIKAADGYLKATQWGEGRGIDKSDPRWGGGGYGKHKRPDLSNTSFLIDALKAAGNSPDDEAMKRALVFVSRCQNLESEANTTPFAAKAGEDDRGGFYYTPAEGGESFAGKTPEGGLRSYGSMTYAGLKSMIYAGVKADDPRVKAAVKWTQMHYGLATNPGMGPSGLYYYYHTFAKALAATGLTLVEDAKGVKHDWRQELLAELLRRQRANGSWTNEDTRWLEADPNLVTGYALLSMAYCRPAAGGK
ncbi:MAG: prenyltransferase/squalene oxidase repeat-containing protein [Thermoguttaceae bacterium]|jgi:squalene-hopene/tetraprenyl-beta-curcumene cyclase